MVGEHFHADHRADHDVAGKEAEQHGAQGLLMQASVGGHRREQRRSGDDEGEHAAVGVLGLASDQLALISR